MTFASTYKKGKDLLKVALDNVDDSKKNDINYRAFRDESTNAFAAGLFDKPGKMFRFLDYTYHVINSQLILEMNNELMAYNELQAPKEFEDIVTKPLHNDEKVIFLFKGGTVMHILYKRYFKMHNDVDDKDSIDMAKQILEIHNEQWLKDHLGVIDDQYQIPDEMKLNFNDVKGEISPEERDNFRVFIDHVLKPGFKVSDIDYTLYIVTDTNNRYLILHEMAVKILFKILDKITEEFDKHLEDCLDESLFENFSNPRSRNYYPRGKRANDNLGSIHHSVQKSLETLLQAVKYMIGNPSFEDELARYREDHGNENRSLANLPDFFAENILSNNMNLNIHQRLIGFLYVCILDYKSNKNNDRLYWLYAVVELLTCIKYINNIDLSIYGKWLDENGCDIDMLYNHYKNNINILINGKRNELFTFPYYDNRTLKQILTNLAKQFVDIKNNDPMLDEKISATFGKKVLDKYQLIKSKYKSIRATDFKFAKRKGAYIYCRTDLPIHDILSNKSKKIHYITFNSIIRVNKGAQYIDFDLLRSKLNLVMNGGYFKKGITIENGDVVESMNLPSEFIDISIPRFDDASYNMYKKHLEHRNQQSYYLELNEWKINSTRKFLLKSYGPMDISQDLMYVLFSQNSIEPWLDKKYRKRIIRAMYFIILNRRVEAKKTNDKTHLTRFFLFFEFIYRINQFFLNGNENLLFETYIKFLRGYSDDQNTIDSMITMVKQNLNLVDVNNKDSVIAYITYLNINIISDKYDDVKNIVYSLMFWKKIYSLSDEQMLNYINIGRDEYKWARAELNELPKIKQDLKLLCSTLLNAGLKIYYLHDHIYNSQNGGISTDHNHRQNNKTFFNRLKIY